VDPLDRELASLLSVEPSPEFRARVRARIEIEPPPRAWFPRWGAVAAGVAVLSVIAVLVLGRGQLTGSTRRDVARPVSSSVASDSVTSDSVASGFSRTIDSPPRAMVAAPVTTGQETNRRRRQRAAAEVLVAASEVRGLRQLAAIVRQGRTQFVFQDKDTPAVSPEPVQDIVVAPITVTPLETAAVSESAENSEGDEQ
jgi:hypothetical protein